MGRPSDRFHAGPIREPSHDRANTRAWITLSACALVVAALLAHVAYYLPFLSDDALISMRYAERLAEGHGLTFTDGERVEGYTNLLWVLLLAGGRVLGVDPILASRVLGLGAVAAGAVAIVLDGAKRGALDTATVTGFVYAASAPLAVWAIGGLEHGFMAGLYTLALLDVLHLLRSDADASRQPLRPAMLLAALTLCRADALALTVPVALGYAWALGRGEHASLRAAKLLAPSVIAYVGTLGFRLAYYGELVPNTAVAKVAIGWHRAIQGLTHVGQGAVAPGIVLALALVGAVIAGPAGRRLLLVCAASWSAYVAFVGGDIFPAWRQLMLAYPPLILLAGHGLEWLRTRFTMPLAARVAGAALLVGSHFALQHRDAENERGKLERWEHDGKPVGRMLATAFGKLEPLLAVDAAGAVPYFSRLPTLDMLGLTDHHIAHARPPDFGLGGIGHELGDGAYVLRRRPDLIVFCGTRGHAQPCFRGGHQMWATPAFHEAYRRTRFAPPGADFEALVFVRRKDGPLGIQRHDARIDVPGWLLGDSGRTHVELDDKGAACTRVRPREPARIDNLSLPEGRWRVSVQATGAPIAGALGCAEPTRVNALAFASRASFTLAAAARVELTVGGLESGTSCIHRVRFERVDTKGSRIDCRALATQRLVRAWDEVSGPPIEGDEWAGARQTVFGKAGLRIERWPASAPTRIEMTVDANDTYLLNLGAGDEVLHRQRLKPRPGASGMVTHTVAIPGAVAPQVRWLDVEPVNGDGRYSLGRVQATSTAP